jgi:pimeloyl-ACP methyl ester carboxylesterase
MPVSAQALASLTAVRLYGGARERRRLGAVDLTYYRLGRRGGEPWVLLHGLGSSVASWMPLFSELRPSCRMLLPELSALGGTYGPSAGLNPQQGAELVAHLIDEDLDGQPVTLLGTSLGGWMAIRLALARPDLVARLVLIDAGGYRDQDWDQVQRVMTVSGPRDVDDLYGALFSRPPALLRLSRWAFFRTYTSEAVRCVLASTGEEHAFGDRELGSIRAPTALIWGEHDGVFSIDVGRAMARALPTVAFYPLSDCGHVAHWEQLGPTIAALRDFRARFPPPRREPSRLAAAG